MAFTAEHLATIKTLRSLIKYLDETLELLASWTNRRKGGRIEEKGTVLFN